MLLGNITLECEIQPSVACDNIVPNLFERLRDGVWTEEWMELVFGEAVWILKTGILALALVCVDHALPDDSWGPKCSTWGGRIRSCSTQPRLRSRKSFRDFRWGIVRRTRMLFVIVSWLCQEISRNLYLSELTENNPSSSSSAFGSRDSEVRVPIPGLHLRWFLLPAFLVILDDAKAFNPKITDA